MTIKVLLCALAFSSAISIPAAALVLPSACGNQKVKFDIATKKGEPALARPENGKALIVFVEKYRMQGNELNVPTVRFAMDGAWLGATRGDSYFTVSVAPGVHHFCANRNHSTGVAPLAAEAGKVYYYEATVTLGYAPEMVNTGGFGHRALAPMANTKPVDSFEFIPLLANEGQQRVKVSKLSFSKPKH